MSKNCRIASCFRSLSSPRRLIKPMFGLVAAAMVAAATAAAAADSVIASVSATTSSFAATPGQELAAATALATYDASVRKALESIARYPGRPEARDGRLQGKVTVEFRVDRNGTVQEREIIETSRSRVLDTAALATVRRAKYQPLPADLLPGETGRLYQMTFDYRFLPQD
jgi:periplasmic protein TonB